MLVREPCCGPCGFRACDGPRACVAGLVGLGPVLVSEPVLQALWV